MIAAIKKHMTSTDAILVFSGVLFLLSVLYIAAGGGLFGNYLAKGVYMIGVLLLITR